jgi:hypothetical protein
MYDFLEYESYYFKYRNDIIDKIMLNACYIKIRLTLISMRVLLCQKS